MPDLLTDADVGISNVLSYVDVGIAPRSEYDYLAPLPTITAEQLGEEHVSHPALPIQSPAPSSPTQGNQYDYLAPLPPITEAQLAEDTTPWSQRPAMTILAPRDAEGIGGIPRIPTFGPEGSKVRVASEFAQTAQESIVGGIEGMTTPESARILPLFALPYIGPAMAAVFGTEMASQGLAEVITGAELKDPRIAGSGFGKVVLSAPLLRAGLALPRSRAALEESRVAAARDITPRPPLQIPERFVEAPLPEQPIRTAGGPIAIQEPSPTPQVRGVPAQPVADEGVVPAQESVAGVPRSIEETQAAGRPEVPLTDPVGNTADFYSLPRLRALDRSKDPRLAAAKKYYGAKTVPDLARLAKARFDEMAAKAKPLQTREEAEMARVQALPEGPEGEAQLVAEDIANAVNAIDVSDVAGFSPVPALVRIIRRAARDPAMKTAAEQAMRKIGDAARAQGVPLDTIKTQIAGELKAIYGDDASEMAKSFFGEETPSPETPAPKAVKVKRQLERPPDIIDEIQGRIGKIAFDAARKIRENLKPTGAARKLFSRSGGNAPDIALDALHREGLFRNITTEDEFLQAIEDASKARKGQRAAKSIEARSISKQQDQRVDFEQVALQGKRAKTEPKATQPISVSDLFEGDVFQLAGEDVKVKEIVVDPESGDVVYMVLEDGRRFEEQTVGGESVIYPDKGTLKQKEVEFLPPEPTTPKLRPMEKSGELFQGQDQPFNLAGEKGIDVERIAREKAEAEKTKKEAAEIAARRQTEFPPGSVGFFPRRSESFGMGEPSMPPTVEDVRRQRAKDLAPPPDESPPSQPSPPPESETKITDAPERKDVMPARNWWASSEFEFRTIPEAAPLVTKLVEAGLGFEAQVGRDVMRMNQARENLSKVEQIQVTTALREAQKGNRALLESLPEKLKPAAGEWRSYFDDVKEAIIAEKKRELIEVLPDARGRAVRDILGGMSESEAFRRNRLRAAGKETVRSAIKELNELNDWGPEDYVTNIERGSYRVVDPNGTTVATALTRVGAKEKALQYAKEHPGVKSLTITDEFDPGIESPTKLSKGQYYRTISRLSKAIGEDAAEVQRLLRADGAVIAIKPTNKYAGPLQKRRNILKGEENLWDALPTYAYSVRKKLALDPVLKEVRDALNTLPENARQQVEELANDVKGRKTVGDKIVDYALSPLGTQAFGYSRGVNLARRITTIAKLGYRPVTALINRLGGMHHTWTKAGTQWFLEGRRFMKTPEFKELWEANRDYVGDAAIAFTEGAKPGDVAWWHPLKMFQWAEHVNRPEAFATFYKFAEGELKMSPSEAAKYARWQTRFAQFVYTTGSLPRMFRGPTGRLVGQFKPYLVRELEFLSTLDRQQWPRYLAGFMALGGPRAIIYMLRSLPILGAAGILYAIEDWLNRKAPRASRGVGGAAGIDVTAAVTPQLPSRTEDWAGPTLSGLVTLYRDIIGPAMAGEKRDARDIAQWGVKLAPMMSYWYDLVESAMQREGWNVDEQGRPDYKPSTTDKIKMAMGAQPLEKSIQAVESRYLNHLDEITRANRGHLVDRFIRALDANDSAEMERMIAQFAEYGITSDTIKNAMKQRHMEPRDRLRSRLLKVLRPKLAEREAEQP